MKKQHLLLAFASSFGLASTKAQPQSPSGYIKARIVLVGQHTLTGFIKQQFKKHASIVFVDTTGKQRQTIEGNRIQTIVTETDTFICINGDFFKVLSMGKLCLLQKESEVAGKVTYQGLEPMAQTGTMGNIGDYFMYTGANRTLFLLHKKTVEQLIESNMAGCAEAIRKAKATNGDLAKLSIAIDFYNQYISQQTTIPQP